MTKSILTAILALTIGASAAARTLEINEGAYEIILAEIEMPRSPVGTALFRTCSSCETIGLRATTSTRYSISGRSYPLREFREAVDRIRDRDGGNGTTFVGVFYDLETKQVTHIDVFPQPQ